MDRRRQPHRWRAAGQFNRLPIGQWWVKWTRRDMHRRRIHVSSTPNHRTTQTDRVTSAISSMNSCEQRKLKIMRIIVVRLFCWRRIDDQKPHPRRPSGRQCDVNRIILQQLFAWIYNFGRIQGGTLLLYYPSDWPYIPEVYFSTALKKICQWCSPGQI